MGLWIAKVHQESISQELRDMPLVALDNVGTHPLIRPYHVPVLFGVELTGELCGVHETTNLHRGLGAFGFRRGRGDWGGLALRRRALRWGRQWHWRSGSRYAGRPSGPDQDSSRLVTGHLFGLNEFGLEVFE